MTFVAHWIAIGLFLLLFRLAWPDLRSACGLGLLDVLLQVFLWPLAVVIFLWRAARGDSSDW